MSFSSILDKYRKISYSQRDKGDRFERLMKLYLLTDPKYAQHIDKIWLWNEFPGNIDLGGKDTGIDLVVKTKSGDYWAVQCKCYQENARIDKPSVDTFLSTSGRTFKDEYGKTRRFDYRYWISTTNNWGSNATDAIKDQEPPVTRINLFDLYEAPVDWDKIEQGVHGEKARTEKKSLRPHQTDALKKANEYFKTKDRGKLIMACGTGKTFNSLRIAENETEGKGLILFLVPSIALLGQTLREWSADAKDDINAVCICSDPKVSQKRTGNEDSNVVSVVDLAYPASTDADYILYQFEQFKKIDSPGMTVVFSTYHSIDVIAKAQKKLLQNGYPEFDLIICDEAHRTTGVTLKDDEESAFVKVHSDEFIKAKKRMYMTATPRLYDDNAKTKAELSDAVLCSMDDPDLYGEEIYRIGFGEAVERDLLTDYKVIVLTLNDKDIPPAVQKMISEDAVEIETDDVSKLIGSLNALSKKFYGDDLDTIKIDPEPMRKAVAFCPSIKASKKISNTFNSTMSVYVDELPEEKKEQMVAVSAKHIDGSMSATDRDSLLSWLKDPSEERECRILTNVRVLSEGVDVPSLDAVMFLSPRNSQVDVVQSVGRVMRRAEGKKYGYIIIPVIIPSDVKPEVAMQDNERFKVVWTVLNALRAHDDRFNAIVNKIELNKNRPPQILIGRTDTSFGQDGAPETVNERNAGYDPGDFGAQLALEFEQLQGAVFARMVEKVGDRRYWEQWAKDVAIIAERQIERIEHLIETKKDQRIAFNKFLEGLQSNINPSITEDKAVEMLAQHIITRPVFEALFEGYSFVESNPVSQAMQQALDDLEGKTVEQESETLQKFYDSVRKRAEGIDNAQGKQKIIIELYDKFFKTAFPRMVEQLGIVYTPVEVVDFIIRSVDDVLKQEFGRGITDENVHVLDPFTGTGTFITRLLQSGLIEEKDLDRKYLHELHANEIVLLAYYIAAVNIENAYHDATPDPTDGIGTDKFTPFDGIVLTDSFQLYEEHEAQSAAFTKNFSRIEAQQKAPIQVIMGNPPYSVGQRSANDNAQNQKYPALDAKIAQTYAAATKATNKNSLYDSYIKAFRWATDRLDKEHGGVVAFVSNSAWLDGNAQDGFRKHLQKDFSSIWIFNLRGNQRTSGELSRREGGKIFGSGSRTPIAITLLVKNPESKRDKARINYYDIGDYLSREEKLSVIAKFGSVTNPEMNRRTIKPDEHGDWLNKRNESFGSFVPLGDKQDKSNKNTCFVPYYSNGLKTQRDVWCYNSSLAVLKSNIKKHLDFYNDQRIAFQDEKELFPNTDPKAFVDRDPTKISWTRALERDLNNNKAHFVVNGNFVVSYYRPFYKQYLFYAKSLNEMVYQIPKLFPSQSHENLLICVSGVGVTKEFTCIMTNIIPDLELIGKSQCFPLYYYEEKNRTDAELFGSEKERYERRDGVSDYILKEARSRYGRSITKEDIFYYVYGILHSPDYRKAFSNDLKKMLPRIPLVDEGVTFAKFSKAGRKLADLHINYESVPPCEEVEVSGDESGFFQVKKMRFPKKDGVVRGKKKKVDDKSAIFYNSKITLTDIPDKAYDYVVNGKSAIEWIMERYQVKIDKKSGIKNDPNDWAEEVGNPRYILDLLLGVINLSVQTVDIVNDLPKLEFD